MTAMMEPPEDDTKALNLSNEAIQQVMVIVTKATLAKRPLLPSTTLELRLERIQRWFLSHAVHAAIVMFVTALLAVYSKSRPLFDTMLVLSVIAPLLMLPMFAALIVSGSLFFMQMRKTPYNPFLSLVRLSACQDLAYANELAGCQKEALQYVLVHYKQERNGYERRSGMLAGAIDKVGIFPALAGLVLLVANLLKVPGATQWGTFFGPLLLAFYFLSMASCHMTQKMDRVIALLEFSVQAKK